MQIFELYFSPEKEDKFSETFCYDPKDAYQGRVGRIYMVGEIYKARKSESSLLSNIFHAAKEKYYEDPSLSADKALKESLRVVNEIVQKKELIGRLGIVFLSSKNLSLYIGKIGKVKVFLLSKGRVANIGREVEENNSPIFQNIISGNMSNKDKIVILSSGMYTPFVQEKILEEMAVSSLDEQFMEKISSTHEKKFPRISGASLIIDYTITSIKDQIIITPKLDNFSYRKTFLPFLEKIRLFFQKKPSFKTPPFNKKILNYSLLLVLVFIIGLTAINISEKIKEDKEKELFASIEIEINKGKLLFEDDPGNAFKIFEDALLQLSKMNSRQAKVKTEELEDRLYKLSAREEIKDLTVIAEVKDINPQSIIVRGEEIYLFDRLKMAVVNKNGETRDLRDLPAEISLQTLSLEGVMLFSEPDRIIRFIENNFFSLAIDKPYEGYKFISISSFNNKSYFLEEKENEIIFYGEKYPSLWIKEGEKKHGEGIDIAIDRSIFVLSKDNRIHRYYTGTYQEEITFFIYPPVSHLEKIYTAIDFPLVITEPKSGRIIVISKEGEVIKQIYNKDIYNLKDLAISSDGKKIYLLIDQKVYLFEI